MIGLALVGQRPRVRLGRVVVAERALVVLQVVGHVQVEVAIPVVVEPGRGDAPQRLLEPRRSRDVGEGAVAVVAVEDVGAVVQDVEIEIAVAVVVGRGGAHAVAPVADAGLLGDVGERAVAVVAVEGVGQLALAGRGSGCR